MVTTTPADALDRGRLRSLPIFADCSDANLVTLLRGIALVTADAGEVLLVEGDPSDYAFVILSGTTSVTRAGDELASLGSGDLFGETAMVAGGLRTATVRATTRVELLRLDAHGLAELTGTQTIAWTTLQSLLERISRRDDPPTSEVTLDAPATTTLVGEDLQIAERVVIAPGIGVFHPCIPETSAAEGKIVMAGQVLGSVKALGGEAEVRSPFGGFLMGMLALDGEHVHPGQPIAWLRTF